MDFCGCGEDIALNQMFSEEEQATFSTSDGKDIVGMPVVTRPISSLRPWMENQENRQEQIVVETVDSDGTMERQTVFDPKGRDAPAEGLLLEPTETNMSEEETNEKPDAKASRKKGNKKGGKKLFKLLKLKTRSKKK